jgi:hypothetical protein
MEAGTLERGGPVGRAAYDEGGAEMGGGAGAEQKSPAALALMNINGIVYETPPSLSVFTSRVTKRFVVPRSATAHKLSSGNPLIIPINSGMSWVDLRNSFLYFEVVFPGIHEGGGGAFGRIKRGTGYTDNVTKSRLASWAQLFRGYRITHATGVEMDSVQCADTWNQLRLHNNKPEAYRRSIAAAEYGYTPLGGSSPLEDPAYSKSSVRNSNTNATRPNALDIGESYGSRHLGAPIARNLDGSDFLNKHVEQVRIPLGDLFDMFDTDRLAPPYLLSGTVIELIPNSKENFFIRPAEVPLPAAERQNPQTRNFHQGPYPSAVTTVNGFVAPRSAEAARQFGNETLDTPWLDTEHVALQNLQLHLSTYTPTDAIARTCAQISADQGLDWCWTAVHSSTKRISQQDTTMQVAAGLSRANMILVKVRNAGDIENPVRDSFSSLPMLKRSGIKTYRMKLAENDFLNPVDNPTAPYNPMDGEAGLPSSVQARVGAVWIPSQPMTGDAGAYYQSAIEAWGGMHRLDGVYGPTPAEFAGRLVHVPGSAPLVTGTNGTLPATSIWDNIQILGYNSLHEPADLNFDGIFMPVSATKQLGGSTPQFPPLYTDTSASVGILAIPLEVSPVLDQAGLALSAQRTAEVNLTFPPPVENDVFLEKQLDLYVPHTKIATLFLGDAVVVRT